MLTRVIAISTALLCASCAPTAGQDKTSTYGAEMNAYIACNVYAARSIAKQTGDPLSLAVAARGMCPKEDHVLHQALLRAHRPAIATEIMSRTRTRILDGNAAAIVSVRK